MLDRHKFYLRKGVAGEEAIRLLGLVDRATIGMGQFVPFLKLSGASILAKLIPMIPVILLRNFLQLSSRSLS
jgi:hypothetical protein